MSSSLRTAINPGGPIAPMVCRLLVILPALLLLYYIAAFSVNVVFWDEWGMIETIRRITGGTFSIFELFRQHNEHRIFFPRIALLLIGGLSKYNTIASQTFSWAIICFCTLVIFKSFRKNLTWSDYPKLLLVFLPVSALLFSFRQYESILWSFEISLYLMIFGVVAAFACLRESKKTDSWFAISVLGAILATFSFASGMMVWPVGLVQILLSERSDWRKAILWCLAGTLVVASYLNGYVMPPDSPPLTDVFKDPLGAATYFLVLIGAPLSFNAADAGAAGLVMVLCTTWIFALAFRGRIVQGNALWLSFILFTILSSSVTVLGRAAGGTPGALSSRYTFSTSLGIIGVYLLAVSISDKLSIKGKNFGFHALVTLIVLGLIVSYSGGLKAGQIDMEWKEVAAYILKTYKIQSNENLRKYLFPRDRVETSTLRDLAELLERKKMSVFAESSIDPSNLVLDPLSPLFAIDRINDKKYSEETMSVVLNTNDQETMTIIGWAVDKQANDVVSAVFVTVDERDNIPTIYGLDRPDVASFFKNGNYRFSGYMATFSSSILSAGKHTISLKVVSKDGARYFRSEEILDIISN